MITYIFADTLYELVTETVMIYDVLDSKVDITFKASC